MVDENKAKKNGWQINMRSESPVMAKGSKIIDTFRKIVETTILLENQPKAKPKRV